MNPAIQRNKSIPGQESKLAGRTTKGQKLKVFFEINDAAVESRKLEERAITEYDLPISFSLRIGYIKIAPCPTQCVIASSKTNPIVSIHSNCNSSPKAVA